MFTAVDFAVQSLLPQGINQLMNLQKNRYRY